MNVTTYFLSRGLPLRVGAPAGRLCIWRRLLLLPEQSSPSPARAPCLAAVRRGPQCDRLRRWDLLAGTRCCTATFFLGDVALVKSGNQLRFQLWFADSLTLLLFADFFHEFFADFLPIHSRIFAPVTFYLLEVLCFKCAIKAFKLNIYA